MNVILWDGCCYLVYVGIDHVNLIQFAYNYEWERKKKVGIRPVGEQDKGRYG